MKARVCMRSRFFSCTQRCFELRNAKSGHEHVVCRLSVCRLSFTLAVLCKALQMKRFPCASKQGRPCNPRDEAADVEPAANQVYKDEGFCVLSSALPPEVAADLLCAFESDLQLWAADCELPLQTYLGVVNKWSHWNSRVASMTETIAPILRPKVEAVLQSEAWPVGSTIFRKSRQASRGTHAHQDLSYAWRPGSQLFSCTTWVALTPASASPLEMLPASHKHGIEAAVDFLDPEFEDKANSPEWKDRAVTVQVDPGDAVLFDSRLWHSAAACSGDLRVALAITWATPAGPDGAVPGEYPRWPASALPPPAVAPKDGFGMDTVGSQLKLALRQLALPCEAESSTALIKAIFQSPKRPLDQLPHPALAEELLLKFLDMRKAVLKHGAAGQNGRLFESLYQEVILPVRGRPVETVRLPNGLMGLRSWLRLWAQSTKRVDALLLFGSHACGEANEWSDLDVCVVGPMDLLPALASALEKDWLRGDGVCFLFESEQKLLAMWGDEVRRLDCFVVENVHEAQKYLATLADYEDAILYCEEPEQLLQELKQLPKPQLSATLEGLISSFVAAFEHASAKRLQGDEYQFSFNLFILQDCLVRLQYLKHGGKQLHEVPKRVLELLPKGVKRQLRWLQKQREGGFLLAAFLYQFQVALQLETPSEFASALQSALQCTEGSMGLMRRILWRDGCFMVDQLCCCLAAPGAPVQGNSRSVIDLHPTANRPEGYEGLWLHVPVPCAGSLEASSSFGQVVRALLAAEFPVLLRCADGRRTASMTALLGLVLSNQSWPEAREVLDVMGMLHLLPPELKAKELREEEVALACGVTPEEFRELNGHFKHHVQVPRVQYLLVPGQPAVPCRSFTEPEVELLWEALRPREASVGAAPRGIFVTGLPAAGKTSSLQMVLRDLNLELDRMVNLDMDGIRRFHGQYQHYAQKLSRGKSEAILLETFEALPAWFHSSGADAVMYKASNSIVSRLLAEGYDFVLPGIFKDASTSKFMEDVIKAGYEVHLVGIHVPAEIAKQRAEIRASESGRLSCNSPLNYTYESRLAFENRVFSTVS